MITRTTFSEILDGLLEYRETYHDPDAADASYDFAEESILAVLSESMNDWDGLVREWLHGEIYRDEDGVANFDLTIRGKSVPAFRVANSGDLYDYLMIINSPYEKEKKSVDAYRRQLLRKHDLPLVSGGDIL